MELNVFFLRGTSLASMFFSMVSSALNHHHWMFFDDIRYLCVRYLLTLSEIFVIFEWYVFLILVEGFRFGSKCTLDRRVISGEAKSSWQIEHIKQPEVAIWIRQVIFFKINLTVFQLNYSFCVPGFWKVFLTSQEFIITSWIVIRTKWDTIGYWLGRVSNFEACKLVILIWKCIKYFIYIRQIYQKTYISNTSNTLVKYIKYIKLEVKGAFGPRLLAGGPSGFWRSGRVTHASLIG